LKKKTLGKVDKKKISSLSQRSVKNKQVIIIIMFEIATIHVLARK
jgi:hypothetical protein